MKKFLHALRDDGELRRRAEQRLREQPAREVRVEHQADTQRLLQELQIHHIELELQNEELKQSKAEADAALEKYTDLYDFAPVGYFSLDEQGVILELNLTGAVLLGIDSLMDMVRTTINVVGNCLASAVIAKWEGKFVDPAVPLPGI